MNNPSVQRGLGHHIACGLLVLIIAIGIGFRFTGLNWDDGAHLHPDERFLTMVVPELDWPDGWSNYFDTSHSPLNPLNTDKAQNFVYGQLPLVVVKAVGQLFHRGSYDGILLVGRALSALFDAGTVLLLVLIGRRCGSLLLGLAAAALLAVTPLNVQQSHFYVVDTFAAFFQMLAFCFALYLVAPVRQDTAPHRRAVRENVCAALAGLAWGAAMACKISSTLFFGALVLLVAMRWWRERSAFRYAPVRRQSTKRAVLHLCLIFFVGCCTFRVAHPMAFAGQTSWLTLGGCFDIRPIVSETEVQASPTLDRLVRIGLVVNGVGEQFGSSLRTQAGISAGEVDVPFNVQWVGRSCWYPLAQLARWAMGWPLMLATSGGLIYICVAWWRRRELPLELHVPLELMVAACWVVGIYIYHARWFSKFTRYYLALTPLAALVAAWALLMLARYLWRSPRAAGRAAGWLAPAGVIGAALVWSLACASIYTRPNPRQVASHWIRANVPRGTVYANETAWDDTLPIGGGSGFVATDLDLFAADSLDKRAQLLEKLDHVEWIFISSNRVWGTVTRLPRRWPLTTTYYRALFDGRLGFELMCDFTNYPRLQVGGWSREFPDDTVEESLTVYDHPRVLLFRKTGEWSRARAAELLSPRLTSRYEIPLLDLHRAGPYADPPAPPSLHSEWPP